MCRLPSDHKQIKVNGHQDYICWSIILLTYLNPETWSQLEFMASKQKIFSTSKPQKIYFSCQITWLNIFLVRSSSYRQINLTLKANLFKHFTWKMLFNSLRNCKDIKNEIITLKSYLKQDNVAPTRLYLVWIIFRRNFFFFYVFY